MTDPREAIVRAHKAESLLSDPLLVEAFDALERAYYDLWRATDARDTDARERLFLATNQLDKVRAHLKSAIADGKVNKATLAQDQYLKDQQK